ncbi:MAG TPA: VF530 family protein [Spongiibacteraceae bacterium]|nr:VF530 family protein [Spongiibacteraceae bacterium]
MTDTQINNPLHGIKLEQMLTELVDRYGWVQLAQYIDINCFKSDPSIKSSLKFLRRTPWARAKVEELYLYPQKFA